ncbi:MAG: three-Cys-motif partner protein TcmP [Phycisphaerae bacterium]
MTKGNELKFDEIGYWSEIKLDILKDYATAYSTILSAQRNPKLYHVYIDGFAGAGVHISKTTGDFVPGSPMNALNILPPFCEYHLVDINPNKVESLKDIAGNRSNVHIYRADCNSILLDEVFPKVQFKDWRRGLCILDPYGLHLNWKVIETAGKMKSMDMFLNFPVADINRNVIWRDPTGVREKDIERMNSFWGDDSWQKVAYSTQGNFFGLEEKEDNKVIAEGFRKRLRDVAEFANVPEPLPMRNTKGAIVYYLFFASQKAVANKIIKDIFNKYKKRGI